MTAPDSLMLPATVTSRSSLRLARSSALVRSSAVRPGARSTHGPLMSTLLRSPDVGGVSRRQMSDSLSGPEIAGLTGLLFMYSHFIADITIAMIRVKQALDGASSATENKFPVT